MAQSKAKVQICYEDKRKDKEIVVDIKGEPKGLRLMSAIEKAVEKAMKDDSSWLRWNLIDVLTAQSLPDDPTKAASAEEPKKKTRRGKRGGKSGDIFDPVGHEKARQAVGLPSLLDKG